MSSDAIPAPVLDEDAEKAWPTIDHAAIYLQSQRISEEMRDLIDRDLGSIRANNVGNSNSLAELSQMLEVHENRTNEWTSLLFAAYLDLLESQGVSENPAFLRAVVHKAVLPFIDRRFSAVMEEMTQGDVETGQFPTDAEGLSVAFRQRMDHLKNHWTTNVENQARECKRHGSHEPDVQSEAEQHPVLEDDWPSVESCLACGHLKMLHGTKIGTCFADPDNTNAISRSGQSLAEIEARKGSPGTCWCRSFTDDPEQASAQILDHGDRAALKRGTNEALDRRDPKNAQLLLTRYIRETPEGERDRTWVDDVHRQIAELRYADAASSPSQAVEDAPRNEFRKVGNTWKIAFQGEECHPQDSIGLGYIAVLLRSPLTPMTGLELQGVAGGTLISTQPTAQSVVASIADDSEAGDEGNEGERSDEWSVSQRDFGADDWELDKMARFQYKEKLRALDIQIVHAEDARDTAEANRLKEERSFIEKELKGSLNVHGRVRVFPGENEKARKSITNAIKRAIQQVEVAGSPNTARYLSNQIATGSKFIYRDNSVGWFQ